MMRALLMTASLVLATPALAQDEPVDRPNAPAPAANAAYEQRENWCEQYTAWFIASTPPQATIAEAVPSDVRDDHEYQVEVNSCKLDPREYERQTHAEAELNAQAAQG